MKLITREKEIADGTAGYWLVRDSDRARFFVSEHVNESALNKVCNRVLSDKNGWGYWIDRCIGRDIKGNVAWMNLDFTDYFI